jgi:hypothetical protein
MNGFWAAVARSPGELITFLKEIYPELTIVEKH